METGNAGAALGIPRGKVVHLGMDCKLELRKLSDDQLAAAQEYTVFVAKEMQDTYDTAHHNIVSVLKDLATLSEEWDRRSRKDTPNSSHLCRRRGSGPPTNEMEDTSYKRRQYGL